MPRRFSGRGWRMLAIALALLMFSGFSLIRIALSAAPEGQWWDLDYRYRRKITVSTGANSPYNGYENYTVQAALDTASLVSDGKMQADGDDLRMLYWNGSGWEELDRHIIDINTASTKVRFGLQADISASSSDDNYYIYYGNSTVTAGPSNLSNVYLWWDDASSDREAHYTQGKVDDSVIGITWADSISWNFLGYYDYNTTDNHGDSMRPTDLSERDAYVEYEEYQTDAFTADMNSGPIVRWVGTGSGNTENSSHFFYYAMASSSYQATPYANHDDICENDTLTVAVANGTYGDFPGAAWTKLGLAAWGVSPSNLKAWLDETPTEAESGSFGIAGRFGGTSIYNTNAGQAGLWLQQDEGRLRNILIRRYTEPEPSLSLSSEEQAFVTTTTETITETTTETTTNTTTATETTTETTTNTTSVTTTQTTVTTTTDTETIYPTTTLTTIETKTTRVTLTHVRIRHSTVAASTTLTSTVVTTTSRSQVLLLTQTSVRTVLDTSTSTVVTAVTRTTLLIPGQPAGIPVEWLAVVLLVVVVVVVIVLVRRLR